MFIAGSLKGKNQSQEMQKKRLLYAVGKSLPVMPQAYAC
jgi:hypothetical protein